MKPITQLIAGWNGGCQKAQEEGSRVLDRLRDGVMEAINLLGQGFVAHSANQALRQALRLGELDKQDYYRELLRLVYRIIFPLYR